MDAKAVETQINQMISFIRSEASEKANEISLQAKAEFDIEKQRLVEEEKVKIRREFERREKQIEVEKKIARSNEIKNSRLQILKAREEVAYSVLQSAFRDLANLSGDAEGYQKLMKSLIIQALVRIDEKNVEIQCRDADTDLVKKILPAIRDEFHKLNGKEINLSISSKKLPPSPSDGHDGPSCCGGVIVSGYEGRIRVDNTLDSRLMLCFEGNLPFIRETLFGSDSVDV
uniref:V-type proton ATPase subunit E n=1 Tax=Stygiella incarcerata TaxID=1712417 RepID=A0A192ZI88_9EUKA|nr:V-type proton ATPase subunit E [Stygiella incarcerata]|eukprot:TRINITY_DN1439_c0_g1_i1.p2 TRINITY_DN1439_c0_g1~~TRINITY_DN1439_c0_g1_i1.p2  ORF type:complete len:230 (-),score=82.45 TRINITY_DN1439_c0_g1_i1:1157-1846(-)